MKPLRRFRMNHIRLLPADAVDQLSTDPGPWLSCDDCFERVDTEVEAFLPGQHPIPADFLAHMRTCPACRQEARTLLELAAIDQGADPADATTRFDTAVRATRA